VALAVWPGDTAQAVVEVAEGGHLVLAGPGHDPGALPRPGSGPWAVTDQAWLAGIVGHGSDVPAGRDALVDRPRGGLAGVRSSRQSVIHVGSVRHPVARCGARISASPLLPP
jgi:hypothetical protein